MSLTKPTDEVDRVVVRLPDDATLFRGPTFIPIAVDATDVGPSPSLLENDAGLGYLAEYQLLDRLCSNRAQLAVDGQLLANGKRITPEQYLKVWRKSVSAAITPAQLHANYGWSLVVQFRGPLSDAALDSSTASWTDCPFKTYGAFRAKYAEAMTRQADGLDALDLDLRTPGAAREAFYARSLLTSVLGYQGSWSAELFLDARRPAPDPSEHCPRYVSEAA